MPWRVDGARKFQQVIFDVQPMITDLAPAFTNRRFLVDPAGARVLGMVGLS